jgi:hypothetical protein
MFLLSYENEICDGSGEWRWRALNKGYKSWWPR